MIGNKEQIIEWLQDKKDDVILEISQKREKTSRSLAQNRYYFLLLDIIANFHGNSQMEQHDLIKLYFKLETTTNLSTDEFTFLIQSIRDLWKTKFAVYLPLPNELHEMDGLSEFINLK
jgi:hypothetical protein